MSTLEIVKSQAIIDLEKQIEIVAEGMATHKIGTKEWLDGNLEVYKLQQAIKVQIANEAKEAKEKEVAEKRNARVALVDVLIESHLATLKAEKDKALSIEEKNVIYDNFKKVRENVVNELLAKYATSTPSARVDGGAPKGEKSEAIRKILNDETAAGKTMAEAKKTAEAAGYTRGTVGTIATEMQKAASATV